MYQIYVPKCIKETFLQIKSYIDPQRVILDDFNTLYSLYAITPTKTKLRNAGDK